jgi:hypothetical protein
MGDAYRRYKIWGLLYHTKWRRLVRLSMWWQKATAQNQAAATTARLNGEFAGACMVAHGFREREIGIAG